MPDSTAFERVEQALAGMNPGEKARLLQKLAGQIGRVVPGIDTDPAVSGGEACITRTRIPVWLLVRAEHGGIVVCTFDLDFAARKGGGCSG